MARFVVMVSLFTAVAASAFGQASTTAQISPTINSQAITLATKSLLAMTGGASVKDITLHVTATSIAGSDNESGPGILSAKSTTESRVDLNLSDGTQSEVRTSSHGGPADQWKSGDGKVIAAAQHNGWTDAAWFFPALSSLAQVANPNYVFSLVGQEQHDGLTVEHLRISQSFPSDTKNILRVGQLSAMDFYLDPTSFLPLAVSFNTHPDSDMNTNIPIEVRFADYRSVNGVQVPFHIQRLLNGSLALDIVVTNAVINSGMPDTQFTLQ